MEKILSVSVAAYNVERFIKKNMESFLGTPVSDRIEVLIVDDGSKDSTADIAREYQEKYPETIRLIQQPNAGPGSTVNTGIKNATGKYFRMVDGDDWVKTESLDEFINFLENNDADVVYTNHCKVDNDTMEEVLVELKYPEKNHVLPYDRVCNKVDVMMHNVTYKTRILQDNNITLDNCFYTDMEYLLFPVKYLKTVAVLDLVVYMYRVSLATQSVNINSMVKNKAMHEKVFKHLMEELKASKEAGQLTGDQQERITSKIHFMAGTHISIILAQKPTKETKEELKAFAEYIKSMDETVYERFKNYSTMKLMRYTGYTAFGLMSRYHRKRTGAN